MGKYGRNQMLFDLGQPDSLTSPHLHKVIEDLDSQFDLVMIAEHMDESLVLMRHILCWSLQDVVVFTKNARREELKPVVSTQNLETIRELNNADITLYYHFLSRFKKEVVEFGVDRMAAEVEQLRALREEYYQDCGAREVKGRDETLQFKEYSGLVNSYALANTSDISCVTMFMPELPFLNLIRQRQKEWLSDPDPPT